MNVNIEALLRRQHERANDVPGLHPAMADSDALMHIVDAQNQAEVSQLDFTSPQRIFESYRATPEFRRLYAALQDELTTPKNDFQVRRITEQFSGKAFQDLAYYFYKQSLAHSSRHTLLSSEGVLDFWHWLNPNLAKQEKAFGLDFIEDVAVPDAALVYVYNRSARVSVMCEATTISSSGRLDQYVQGKVNRLGFLKQQHPQLFGSAEELFITPQTDEYPFKNQRVQYLMLPLTSKDLGREIEFLMTEYAPSEDSATAVDFQVNARDQVRRGLMYEKQGKIEENFGYYMKRVRRTPYLRSK